MNFDTPDVAFGVDVVKGPDTKRRIMSSWVRKRQPLIAWCDNAGESLALLLLSDHITALDEAITQVSAGSRNLLITVDSPGASHGLVDHITP